MGGRPTRRDRLQRTKAFVARDEARLACFGGLGQGACGDRGRRLHRVLIYAHHSNVQDRQMFASVWDRLPSNVTPMRSLADSAYVGEKCLAAARQHGATPLHAIKKNARNYERPRTLYQKLVIFARHWPNRFTLLYAKRAHAATVFSMISTLLKHRLRCRSKRGRKK